MTRTYVCRPAPITMVNCFYPAVVFEADPTFVQREATGPVTMQVDVSNIRFEPGPDAANSFVVSLKITLSWPEEAAPPYRCAWLEAVGVFQVALGLPASAFEMHRAMSAPSMLYSSAREYVKLLTLNGPWGGVLLPGKLFQEAESEPEPEVAVPGKSRRKGLNSSPGKISRDREP